MYNENRNMVRIPTNSFFTFETSTTSIVNLSRSSVLLRNSDLDTFLRYRSQKLDQTGLQPPPNPAALFLYRSSEVGARLRRN